LQEIVNRVDPANYDAILLGYALCGSGLDGLEAQKLQLVIPRAHDCIGLLMGGRERYREYFENTPGVYFRSTGWLERGGGPDEPGIGAGYGDEELIRKYGEDKGRYLYDQFSGFRSAYRQLTYIATGLEPDDRFERQALEEAASRGWRFEAIQGDLRLFEKLTDGPWDESDFLVVPPGWRVKAVYDGGIIDKEPIP
jgi:hypothetical protein